MQALMCRVIGKAGAIASGLDREGQIMICSHQNVAVCDGQCVIPSSVYCKVVMMRVRHVWCHIE
jgi:hypothetical protein